MEATTFQMSCALRRLFATILVFCEATNVRALWDKHKEALDEDFSRDNSNTSIVEQMVLKDVRDILYSMGKDIRDYGLPPICDEGPSSIDMMNEVREEENVFVDQDHLDIFDSLNKEQREGFDEIIQYVFANKSQVFFVDGPGGTGKTFLYKALLASVCSRGLIVIATTTSGIAASILLGGRTAHSSFTKQSGTAELLRRASLIIWDEVAMTKRQCVETLDRSLQDIMECALPFGGKVMVFGGDFRQVLPVVTCGTRAQSDPWFFEYLLRIGNGIEETIGDDYVRLPNDIVIGYTDTDVAVNKLIQHVFPALEEHATSAAYMSSRAILSTKNEHVDRLNAMMIERFPLEEKLKINCPVILLHNLDPNNGLCNATRLMVRAMQDNAIDAEIVAGQHARKRVSIPRLPLSPSVDISLPFKFKRKQFPVRLSFAMMINKSQGQTIPNVAIDLPEPVFSHGQLYRPTTVTNLLTTAKNYADADDTEKLIKED
uniref:ATP-dependent DNA helicase n=1 Tax=Sorghum bicolor TaxID=4558 RepID=C6JRR4_SORBI